MDFFTLLYAILGVLILIGGFIGWAIWEYKDHKFYEELRHGRYKGKPLGCSDLDDEDDADYDLDEDADDYGYSGYDYECRDAQDIAAICSNININIL